MKAMICFWGLSEIGKTPAIKTIWKNLKNDSNPPLDTSSDDICDIVSLDGHKIGIESQGDPDSKQKEWIDKLITEECEIIICASRTKGGTVEIVESRAKDYDYELIWLSPLSSIQISLHTDLNSITSESIIKLIKILIAK